MCFSPSLREISLQFGGKIEETRTILHEAIPAFRKASSKLESRSRCLPTPFVRKIFLATNGMYRAGLRCLRWNSSRSNSSVRENNKNERQCQCELNPNWVFLRESVTCRRLHDINECLEALRFVL